MAASGDFVAVELQQAPAPKGGAGAVTESSSAACGLLTWRGVTVTVSDKAGHSRDIVSHATGVAPPGELLAIMGPSGCGKSTLLDSLAGRLKGSARLQGDVRVNGHAASLAYGRSAYVTQDEVLIGTLTVRETLTYAARLRLAGGDAHARSVADAVVADLGLTDAADTLIGTWHVRGVSGGQRRRVAVGCELVISPSLLFLDEPTSGLDAAAAYHVAAVLKRLCAPGGGTSGSTTGPSTAAATAAAGGGGCAAGRTIVAVIHQPSSEMFELLDGLCLMAAGKTVYFGPAAQVDGFFAAAGFATPRGRSVSDHTLHTVNADFGDAKAVAHNVEALLAAYAASPQRAAVHARIAEATAHPGPEFTARAKPPPAAKQVLVLTQRALTNNWRDPGIFWCASPARALPVLHRISA
jgi:ABC-type multidrug transport system ATPase subunit